MISVACRATSAQGPAIDSRRVGKYAVRVTPRPAMDGGTAKGASAQSAYKFDRDKSLLTGGGSNVR